MPNHTSVQKICEQILNDDFGLTLNKQLNGYVLTI